ncbi:hypothetical protein JB92DRAFT_3255669 [Gautieria morchelliformis]|nr:hypothetical protein JB92DRAFT_3255669 [Gautieria morchelliformis]
MAIHFRTVQYQSARKWLTLRSPPAFHQPRQPKPTPPSPIPSTILKSPTTSTTAPDGRLTKYSATLLMAPIIPRPIIRGGIGFDFIHHISLPKTNTKNNNTTKRDSKPWPITPAAANNAISTRGLEFAAEDKVEDVRRNGTTRHDKDAGRGMTGRSWVVQCAGHVGTASAEALGRLAHAHQRSGLASGRRVRVRGRPLGGRWAGGAVSRRGRGGVHRAGAAGTECRSGGVEGWGRTTLCPAAVPVTLRPLSPALLPIIKHRAMEPFHPVYPSVSLMSDCALSSANPLLRPHGPGVYFGGMTSPPIMVDHGCRGGVPCEAVARSPVSPASDTALHPTSAPFQPWKQAWFRYYLVHGRQHHAVSIWIYKATLRKRQGSTHLRLESMLLPFSPVSVLAVYYNAQSQRPHFPLWALEGGGEGAERLRYQPAVVAAYRSLVCPCLSTQLPAEARARWLRGTQGLQAHSWKSTISHPDGQEVQPNLSTEKLVRRLVTRLDASASQPPGFRPGNDALQSSYDSLHGVNGSSSTRVATDMETGHVGPLERWTHGYGSRKGGDERRACNCRLGNYQGRQAKTGIARVETVTKIHRAHSRMISQRGYASTLRGFRPRATILVTQANASATVCQYGDASPCMCQFSWAVQREEVAGLLLGRGKTCERTLDSRGIYKLSLSGELRRQSDLTIVDFKGKHWHASLRCSYSAYVAIWPCSWLLLAKLHFLTEPARAVKDNL